jgi:hypothetical protein
MSSKGKGIANIADVESALNKSPRLAGVEQTIAEQAREIRTLKANIGRREELFKYIGETIKDVVEPIPFVPYKDSGKRGEIDEDAGLIVSDMHCDVPVRGERVLWYENFDFRACCHRAERLVETTISHCRDNLANYKFHTLYVFLDGDLVTGEINNAKLHSEWRNMIIASAKAGALIGSMVADLAAAFQRVVVISLSGNHGRFMQRIDWKAPLENWDYAVSVYAQQATAKYPNVQWIIPDAWSALVNIRGYNFLTQHGHQIKQNTLSVPYYGLLRRAQRLTALGAVKNQVFHYYIQAHRHEHATTPHTTGEILSNGAFSATDEYVFEELAGYSEPKQLLFGIHEKYGVSWRLPVHLRCENWEKAERADPKRYALC